MRYLYFILLFLGAILLQTSFYNPLSWNGIRPDFILILVIYMSLFAPAFWGVWGGFWGGLLEDILSGGIFGSAILSKTLSGYGTALLGDKVVLDNPLVQALLVFVVSLFELTLRFLVLKFLDVIRLGAEVFPDLILPQAMMTTLFASPFFWLLRRTQRRWEKKGLL